MFIWQDEIASTTLFFRSSAVFRPASPCRFSRLLCVICVPDHKGENSFHLCSAAQDAEKKVLHVSVDATKVAGRQLPVAPLPTRIRPTILDHIF
jgi:hypothetical protein